MEIVALLTRIWNRKWIVVTSLFAFLFAALVASVIIPRTYTGETLLEIKSSDSASSLLNELNMAEMAMTLGSGDDDMQNKIFLALAPPVMEDVTWRMQLRDRNGNLFKPEDIDHISLLTEFLGNPGFEIVEQTGTDVLRVKAIGTSKEEAMLMADTLAEVYISRQTAEARAETREAQTFIIDQLEKVKQELDETYSLRANAQQTNNVIDMEWEIKFAAERLSQTLFEQQMLSAKIEEMEGRISSLRRTRRKELAAGGSPISMKDDPVIYELRSRLWTMVRERDGLLRQGYTSKSPEVSALNAEIEVSENLIDQELEQLSKLDPQIADLEAEISGFMAKGLELAQMSERTTQEFSSYPERMREVSSLSLAAEAVETVYKSLADQQYQVGIAEAMTMSDTRILARSVLPEKHSSPKLILNLILAIFLGTAFGVASALALDYIDDTIQDADTLRAVWDIPQLGLIYKYAADKNGIAVANLPATDPISEAYRTVRNSLEFASLDNPIKILGITSSIPGEGKSTTAMNVAASVAKDGRKVLMIDGDLRLPTQHKKFPNTVAAPGIVDIIRRTHTLEQSIQETPVANLFLLAAGNLPPDPGHLIESKRMREVLTKIADGFDLVVIDAPPVLAVNDPIIMARVVDAMAICVESGKATRRMVQEVKSRFEGIRITPVGFILNKVRGSTALYGTYAKHYQKAQLARAAKGKPKS